MRTCLVLVCGFIGTSVHGADPDPKSVEFFENKIRPVLVEKCYSCHSAEAKKSKGNLVLDTKAGLLKGGDSGPAVKPGKPEESVILKALRHQGDLKMPPDEKKLSDAIVKDFVTWIELGAVDPRDGNTAVVTSINWSEARKFWSFQPVKESPPPAVKTGQWAQTPIDRFILAELESKGLKPVATADKRTLIRRATFDLIGLPPTPAEVDAFLADQSPDAFAKVVNRLLDSPHYGERWGRYWLDVARYAEDQAHTFGVKPNTEAWRYRDWVVDAFNQDMPYDRFIRLQIAADSEANETMETVRHRAALGFFGLGAQYYKNTDKARAEADELDDRVDTVTRAFLGLTVSCARCHDHKYDPIPTRDYYSIAGIFWSSKLSNLPLATKELIASQADGQKNLQLLDKQIKDMLQAEKERVALAIEADKLPQYLLAAWKVEAKRLETPGMSAEPTAKADKLNAGALDRFCRFMSRKGPMLPVVDSFQKLMPKKGDKPEPSPEIVKAADAVRDQVKATLSKPANDKARGDLFQALYGEKGVFPITDAEARNQMTPERKQSLADTEKKLDSLKKSLPPTPPTVHGMTDATPVDLKVYIRGNPARQGEVAPRGFLRILHGDNAPKFTQGSGRKELAEAIADPKNPLTARVMVNRIWQHHFGRGIVGTPSNFGNLGERPTHPALLDHLAARFVASGWSVKQLHREIMASAVYQLSSANDTANAQLDADNRYLWRMNRQRLDVEAWRDSLLAVSGRLDAKQGGPTTNLDQPENNRRTVYAKISRHELSGLLRLFDFPDANIHSSVRSETTVAQQQLFVLNSPFAVLQAKSFAARLEKLATNDDDRIREAYRLAYGRSPTTAEIDLGKRFLTGKDSSEEASRNKLTRWERYAQILLAGNEFMYVD